MIVSASCHIERGERVATGRVCMQTNMNINRNEIQKACFEIDRMTHIRNDIETNNWASING